MDVRYRVLRLKATDSKWGVADFQEKRVAAFMNQKDFLKKPEDLIYSNGGIRLFEAYVGNHELVVAEPYSGGAKPKRITLKDLFKRPQ